VKEISRPPLPPSNTEEVAKSASPRSVEAEQVPASKIPQSEVSEQVEAAPQKVSFRAAAKAVASNVRRKTLAEKFGYGVILKTQPQEPEKPAEEAPKSPEKKVSAGFVAVQAGDTDLLQRLAARKRAAAAASGA